MPKDAMAATVELKNAVEGQRELQAATSRPAPFPCFLDERRASRGVRCPRPVQLPLDLQVRSDDGLRGADDGLVRARVEITHRVRCAVHVAAYLPDRGACSWSLLNARRGNTVETHLARGEAAPNL